MSRKNVPLATIEPYVKSHDLSLIDLSWSPAPDEESPGYICTFLDQQDTKNNIVIAMESVAVSIRKIGNSHGFVVPKAVLAQLGLDTTIGAEMSIENDALVLRRPQKAIRKGWEEASKQIAAAGDDALLMGEFANAADADLVW